LGRERLTNKQEEELRDLNLYFTRYDRDMAGLEKYLAEGDEAGYQELLAATKVVDPIAYGAIVEKYNSEPGWIQGGVVYHFNLLLQKPPQDRQAEVDLLANVFPVYMELFRTQDAAADAVAATCPSFPAEDPAVWNLAP
jgi:hypothetical protein